MELGLNLAASDIHVEPVAVEVVEQPAPGVITVTEVEETRQVS
jgi:hypothetical protein